MKILLTFLTFLLSASLLPAQLLVTESVMDAGGSDRFSNVIRVDNDHLLLVGESNAVGNGSYQGFATLVVESGGAVLWSYAVGDLQDDRVVDAVKGTDGGYYLFGYTSSSGQGGQDLFLIKLNANGVLQWGKTYGGSGTEYARQILLLPSGDLLVLYETNSVGAGNHDFGLSRIDKFGDLVWTKTKGGTGGDNPLAFAFTPDYKLVMVGSTQSFGQGQDDLLIIETDTMGNTQWYKVYGSATFEEADKVAVGPDGMIYVAGSAYNSDYDLAVFKLDPQGNLLHANSLGWSDHNFPANLTITSDYRVFVGGQLRSPFSQSRDYALMEVDTACELLWANIFGRGYEDYMRDMVWLGDGASFLLFGFSGAQSSEDLLWFRTDANGESLCDMNHYGLLTGQPLSYTETQPFLAIGNGPIVASNWLCTTSPTSWTDTILCVLGAVHDPLGGFQLEMGPNPCSELLRLAWTDMLGGEMRIGLLDLSGRKLMEIAVPANRQAATLDLAQLPEGIYLVECRMEGGRETRRVVVSH